MGPFAYLRIAIISPQPLFRAGLIACFKSNKSIEVVFEGASSGDALIAARDHQPDVVLFDAPVQAGRIAIKSVASAAAVCQSSRLIILSGSDNEDDATAVLGQGAQGYILKDVQPNELCRAIDLVRTGQVYLSASLGARLVSKALGQIAIEPVQPTGLSEREEEILSRAAIGLTNKEIARDFSLSEKTVKYYMTNIMKKLHVRNRVEAVMMSRPRVQRECA